MSRRGIAFVVTLLISVGVWTACIGDDPANVTVITGDGSAPPGDGSADGFADDVTTDREIKDTAPPDPCLTADASSYGLVFVTSTRYTGNLGGVAGADSRCQAHALDAGLSGNFRAWLSSDDVTAVDRIITPAPARPYRRLSVDGGSMDQVVRCPAQLATGRLDTPIQVTEKQDIITGAEVWTGTRTDGTTSPGLTCSAWTAGNGANGTSGRPTESDGDWTKSNSSGTNCGLTHRLYCFEVP